MEPRKTKSNIINLISIAVTIFSALVAIYVVQSKKKSDEYYQQTIAEISFQLLTTISGKSAHEKELKKLQFSFDSITYIQRINKIKYDSVQLSLKKQDIVIANLKTKLNEIHTSVPIGPDEQIRFFLHWTSQWLNFTYSYFINTQGQWNLYLSTKSD